MVIFIFSLCAFSITDRLNGADLINIQCRSYPNAPEGKILPITVYISKGETDPDEVIITYF